MRIVVMSDSHGRLSRLRRVFADQPEAEAYLFLGDGLKDWAQMQESYPDRRLIAVCGNCDGGTAVPAVRTETFGGVTVMMTHGHLYKVKYDLTALSLAARERSAAVALFGHTHQACEISDRGLQLVNPGSVGADGAYAVLDIGRHGVLTSLCHVTN